MANDLNDLDDCDHLFGEDLVLSPSGDIARVRRTVRSEQRVFRRLLTAEGGYVFHPDYGAGLPQQIGRNLDLAKQRARIRGQMLKEFSVAQAPPPSVDVREINGGVAARVGYIVRPDMQPVSLAFTIEE